MTASRCRWARVAAEPGLILAAVEETLRYDPSVPVWRRVTTRPVTIGGVDLPEGARLFLWLAAGGRDGAVFPEPDRFDLDRGNSGQHLAFGLGLHYRLGANLGRLETRLELEELARRYPEAAPGREPGVHLPPEHLVPRPAGALGAHRRGTLTGGPAPGPGANSSPRDRAMRRILSGAGRR
jgi:cytochrome P450